MYSYDFYGWLSDTPITGRETNVVPLPSSGDMRPNFTGHKWLLTKYTPPPTFTPDFITLPQDGVPQVVSRAQFILALLQLDLLDDVESAIAQADRATQINYSERLEFERGHPLIETMAAVLGKTDAEIDALFVLAATK